MPTGSQIAEFGDPSMPTGSSDRRIRRSPEPTGSPRPPARLTLPHFVTLVDAWPPAPIQCLTEPRPMSSLTWTLELLAEPPDDPSAQWWYEVETDAAHHGYAHTHATVFTPEGRPIAISRQSISIFG